MSDLVLSTDPAPAPGAALGGLAIRLFGPMEVRIGPRPLPRLRSRKGLWLLALLALRTGRPVERDWLAGTLWPECDEAHARRNLRQNLHNLRVALGPEAWRLADDAPRTLRLDVGGASVDALAFDAAIARGDLESLEAAVQQYRGPLPEDCVEAWCLEERRPRDHEVLPRPGGEGRPPANAARDRVLPAAPAGAAAAAGTEGDPAGRANGDRGFPGEAAAGRVGRACRGARRAILDPPAPPQRRQPLAEPAGTPRPRGAGARRTGTAPGDTQIVAR